VKLLPEEKKSIEQRGTNNLKAYNYYLLARSLSVNALGRVRRFEPILRLCDAAVKLDANYARAWALMAINQALRTTFHHGAPGDGLDAANRAIDIDPMLADGHMAKARVLLSSADAPAALAEIEIALKLSPDDVQVNAGAGLIYMFSESLPKAVACYQKATAAEEANFWTLRLLGLAHRTAGETELARQVSQRVIARAHAALLVEPDSGLALGALTEAYAMVGDRERVHETAELATLLDPDNFSMKLCLANAFAVTGDVEHGLDALEHALRHATKRFLAMFKSMPLLFSTLRTHPKFGVLVKDAEARLAHKDVTGV
jgi:adenylate cyclase